MGIDWVRRAEERYRHQMQVAASELPGTPLFDGVSEEILTIPCHWLKEEFFRPVGTRLTIFYRSDRANLAVLLVDAAVAEVRGEAAKDLKALFFNHPELQGLLGVQVVEAGSPSDPFYVQLAGKIGRPNG